MRSSRGRCGQRLTDRRVRVSVVATEGKQGRGPTSSGRMNDVSYETPQGDEGTNHVTRDSARPAERPLMPCTPARAPAAQAKEGGSLHHYPFT